MAPTPEHQDWRSIAAQASKEMNEDKLLLLVEQLCNAFDERHKRHQPEHDQDNVSHLRKPTANS
jgi:hypothetical protein